MSLFENPLKKLADFESLEESIKKEKFPLHVTDMSEPGKAHLISELMKEDRPLFERGLSLLCQRFAFFQCGYKIFADNFKKS